MQGYTVWAVAMQGYTVRLLNLVLLDAAGWQEVVINSSYIKSSYMKQAGKKLSSSSIKSCSSFLLIYAPRPQDNVATLCSL